MSPYRAALLALVVAGVALASAVPAGATSGVAAAHDGTPDALGGTDAQVGAAVDAEERASVGDAQADENETNDSALGADISSFMQSSVAEADGAVENGMWSAAFDGTENQSVREQLVERRTDELRSELAELRAEKAELMSEREAGNVSETAYKARISRLAGQIDALESSINATSSRARTVGADVEELRNLQSETQNLSGPEVAAVARNVTGVGNGNGPPDDAGNGTANAPGDAGANDTTSDADRRGPPSDAGNAPFANDATEDGAQSQGIGNGAPGERASDETPGNGAGDETPGQGNGDGTPGEGVGDEAPGQGHGDEAPGEGVGNEAAEHNGTPGNGGGPGHEGAPGRGPKALASPTDLLDGSDVQALPGSSVVSTVRFPAADLF